jgi:methyl-accepting chemotaxis protein
MKVKQKLIVSFLIVLAMTVIVGGVGIFSMRQIDAADSELYESHTVPMQYMTKITETIQKFRVNTREYIIASLTDDHGKMENTLLVIEGDKKVMKENIDLYVPSIIPHPEILALFNEARTLYEREYIPFVDMIYALARENETDLILYEQEAIRPTIEKIIGIFEQCLVLKTSVAKDVSVSNTKLANASLVAIIIALVLAVAVAILLALYIAAIISGPLLPLAAFMTKASVTGEIVFSQAHIDFVNTFSKRKDEIGATIAACNQFIQRVLYISQELETVSEGDLTSEINLLSDQDVMGNSLVRMIDNLNNMFSEIKAATGQVSIGSKQVADGAQSLAQGSTEQAASVQELSASIADIAQKTKNNADKATSAANLANTIKENAEKGSRQMDEMMSAVKDINHASQNISKVIKVIDDIAFQTNILALNAAVEAARAGQHGKGFAVVAEEVRNLAAKSAEAAKETGDMIQNSMEKAELGARIAGETATSLSGIVSGINESDQIVNEIAHSSEVQAAEIRQINVGIDQVAQVIQQNSATAEESAAASEEMSSQSNLLEELIAQFKLKDSYSSNNRMSSPMGGHMREVSNTSGKAAYIPDAGFDDYDKY